MKVKGDEDMRRKTITKVIGKVITLDQEFALFYYDSLDYGLQGYCTIPYEKLDKNGCVNENINILEMPDGKTIHEALEHRGLKDRRTRRIVFYD